MAKKETKKVKEAKVEEKEDFLDEKKDKKEYEKTMFYKVSNIILWIVFIIWAAICLTDFVRVRQLKEPAFCIKKQTTQYQDGVVDSCLGVGYKVYNYKRDSYRAVEFGPFWAKDRSAKQDEEK